LRLFTLWFKFGGDEDVSHAVTSGFTSLAVDTWLEVIPQVRVFLMNENFSVSECILPKIIARIQTPAVNIRRTINLVLTQIGTHHPHALIYPLTVASQSTSAVRKRAALAIMNRMKEHSASIVEQVNHVSIRTLANQPRYLDYDC
jgi:serine/threonine-protein kinase mTOR